MTPGAPCQPQCIRTEKGRPYKTTDLLVLVARGDGTATAPSVTLSSLGQVLFHIFYYIKYKIFRMWLCKSIFLQIFLIINKFRSQWFRWQNSMTIDVIKCFDVQGLWREQRRINKDKHELCPNRIQKQALLLISCKPQNNSIITVFVSFTHSIFISDLIYTQKGYILHAFS